MHVVLENSPQVGPCPFQDQSYSYEQTGRKKRKWGTRNLMNSKYPFKKTRGAMIVRKVGVTKNIIKENGVPPTMCRLQLSAAKWRDAAG